MLSHPLCWSVCAVVVCWVLYPCKSHPLSFSCLWCYQDSGLCFGCDTSHQERACTKCATCGAMCAVRACCMLLPDCAGCSVCYVFGWRSRLPASGGRCCQRGAGGWMLLLHIRLLRCSRCGYVLCSGEAVVAQVSFEPKAVCVFHIALYVGQILAARV
jgi:hypothetical protein